MKKFFSNAKTKASIIGAGLVAGATNSFGAVTYDTATNTFTGAVDLAAYYSGVEIAIAVISVTLAVGLAVKMLKRGSN